MAWIGDLVENPDDLKTLANKLDKLAEMPERTTRDDLRSAARALTAVSNDVRKLLKHPLVGCPCRRIQDDNFDYLVYADECQHHRHLKHETERLKKAYADAQKKLEVTHHTEFMASALAGIAAFTEFERDPAEVAERARALADACVAALLR